MTTVVQNGNRVSVSIAAAAAVTIVTTLFDPSIAATTVTAFFAFLGGLMLGKQL